MLIPRPISCLASWQIEDGAYQFPSWYYHKVGEDSCEVCNRLYKGKECVFKDPKFSRSVNLEGVPWKDSKKGMKFAEASYIAAMPARLLKS